MLNSSGLSTKKLTLVQTLKFFKFLPKLFNPVFTLKNAFRVEGLYFMFYLFFYALFKVKVSEAVP